MLLTLPTELVQLILRSCDPPTYLQTAFCCRTLYEIASNSRDLIFHQVCQTPGLVVGIDSLSAKGHFQLLLRRAHEGLFGAEFDGDRKLFDFHGKVIDSRASTLEAAVTRNQALLAFKGHGTVYLFDIRKGDLSLQRGLDSPARHFGKVEVLQTAVDSHGVYVLHRLQPFIDKDLDTSHPFVKHALQSNPKGRIFLACHEPNTTANRVRLYAFHDLKDYEPLALAVHDEKFAISWQHLNRSGDHQVVLYRVPDAEEEDEEEETEDGEQNEDSETETIGVTCSPRDSYVLTEMNEEGASDDTVEEKGPTVKLAFNDRGCQLLHHYRAHTLYGSFQRIHSVLAGGPQPGVHDNACEVNFSDSLTLQFSIGIPFFGTHEADDASQGLYCHWQYLAVGIATHRVEHWTVACLLKSEALCRADRCGHVLNLDRGRRYDDWKIMGQLGGFQESNTSHGSLIAASALGTRVAIASWKTVSIWALEPHALIEGEEGFYPESWRSSDGFTELRPVVIQLDAVCSQLRFTDSEDELVAITDRGLLLMNLRPNGKGVQAVDSRSNWIANGELVTVETR